MHLCIKKGNRSVMVLKMQSHQIAFILVQNLAQVTDLGQPCSKCLQNQDYIAAIFFSAQFGATRQALSQFCSFEIRRTTFLNYIAIVDPRILRL